MTSQQRRRLLVASGAMLAAPIVAMAPLVSHAQQSGRAVRLGLLRPGPLGCPTNWAPTEVSLRQGLEDVGYVAGKNLVIERRCFPRLEQLPAVVAELISARTDIIVVYSAPAALAVKQADGSTPIVFVDASEVLKNKLVATLARPGGNATGLTSLTREIAAKRLELLCEAVPAARRIAVLANPSSSSTAGQIEGLEAASKTLAITLSSVFASADSDLDRAFTEIGRARADALVVLADPFFFVQRERIVSLATAAKLPAIYSHTDFVKSGGLFAYAADLTDMSKRAAIYVDRIIKGARPADIPVEQPTRFEFEINLKTAKILGLTVPPPILVRASRVIE